MLPTHRWKASLQCGCVVSCFPLVLADCVPTSFCPLHTKQEHQAVVPFASAAGSLCAYIIFGAL